MTLFYHAFIESVLLFTLAAWFGNLSLKNKNSLNQIVNWSSRLIGEPIAQLRDPVHKTTTTHMWFNFKRTVPTHSELSASPLWEQV